MSGQRVVVIGATGMVGGAALRQALASAEVAEVTVIGRRACEVQDAKLRERIHADFLRYEPVADALADQDAALFCLGAYTGTLPDDQFKRLTVDVPLAFARALLVRSPNVRFSLLSGQGADRSERARMPFARYKGAVENGLLELDFAGLYLFRPAYIYPVQARREPNAMYRVSRALYPVVRRLSPNAAITSEELAGAMLHAGLHGLGPDPRVTLENRDIRALARRLAAGGA